MDWSFWESSPDMALKNSAAASMLIWTTSTMPLPATVTAKTSGFKRLPLQVGHKRILMYCSISPRMQSESVSLYRLSKFAITPSNGVYILYSPSRYENSPATWTFLSPVPYIITSKYFLGKSLIAVFTEKPYSLATASIMRLYQERRDVVLLQGRMAPSARVSLLFGITKSGSTVSLVPRPLQSGQAPCGELNEKSRGSSSLSDMWPSGHANFWDNTTSWPLS